MMAAPLCVTKAQVFSGMLACGHGMKLVDVVSESTSYEAKYGIHGGVGCLL